jgi:hypothetical protein
MTAQTLLFHFLNASSEDARISPGHISLYLVLVKCWTENNFEDPFPIIRDQVMNRAKINGRTTYQKYIQDLHQYGYIGYTPSYNHFLGSLISMESFARISGKSEKEMGNAGEQPGKR